MDTNTIVEELTQQRDRVVAAIKALTGANHTKRVVSSAASRRRGKMSATGKRRISLAMKARWAKAKKAGKNAL
jgi:hypothetical protein